MPLTDSPVNFCEIPTLQFPLVNRFYKANGDKGKARGGERVFALKQQADLLAAVRACPEAEGYLLRSVCVARHARGSGFGKKLLQQARQQLGDAPSWCFPYGYLLSFYQQAGFEAVSPGRVPASVAQRYQRYHLKHHDLLLMTSLLRGGEYK